MAEALSEIRHLESPTVDPGEIERFSKIAADWWNPRGKFRPLHKFNPVRLKFIRDVVTVKKGLDANARRPFAGLRLLDIGCGGGLLSEPMARLGAKVVGVDAAERNIKTAKVHAAENRLDIDYRWGAAEVLLDSGEARFDIILNMEVVEHVADVEMFLRACAGLLAPGGVMIVATINRTSKAFALAIVGAERVLRWLPVGTHRYDKLVKPGEARAPLAAEGLDVEGPFGVAYNPLADAWSLSNDSAVNYMLTATRPLSGPAPTS